MGWVPSWVSAIFIVRFIDSANEIIVSGQNFKNQKKFSVFRLVLGNKFIKFIKFFKTVLSHYQTSVSQWRLSWLCRCRAWQLQSEALSIVFAGDIFFVPMPCHLSSIWVLVCRFTCSRNLKFFRSPPKDPACLRYGPSALLSAATSCPHVACSSCMT